MMSLLSQTSQYNIQSIINAMLMQNKSPNLLHQNQIVWQGFKKMINSQLSLGRAVLVFDHFYVLENKETKTVKMIPTQKFIDSCQLKVKDNSLSNCIGIVTNTTELALYKNIPSKYKQNITKQFAFKILLSIFETIKKIIQQNSEAEIDLGMLGRSIIFNKEYWHQPQVLGRRASQKIRIKQMVQPRRSSLYKNSSTSSRSSGLNLLPELGKSRFGSKVINPPEKPKKGSKISYNLLLFKSLNKQNVEQKRLDSPLRKCNSPQIRICNDLLAAGVDPLTYDYNYSKLVENGQSLMQLQVYKPQPPKLRHPGVIDKFTRTLGCPLNSTKVSNSILVRIGSNYSPWTRHLYIDKLKKGIISAQKELKIQFGKVNQNRIIPATEQEEYNYLVGHFNFTELQERGQLINTVNSFNQSVLCSSSLNFSRMSESQNVGNLSRQNEVMFEKLKERHLNYQRYSEYLQYMIPNSNVSPLPNNQINRIIMGVKSIAIKLGNQSKKQVRNCIKQLINEANVEYYRSYKKAVLDYILKDQSEKKRIGISCVFKPVKEWGESRAEFTKTNLNSKKLIKEAIANLQQNFMLYPQCLMEITKINDQLNNYDFLRLKTNEKKPINILYFIKKQMSRSSEILNLLNEVWVKDIVNVIKKHVDMNRDSQRRIKLFLDSIHTIMSNKLKELIYKSLDSAITFFTRYQTESTSELSIQHSQSDYSGEPYHQKIERKVPPLLHLSFTQENGKIVFTDDLRNIFLKQMINIFQTIASQSNKILSAEYYLFDRQQKYLNGINQKSDQKLLLVISTVKQIILNNLQQIYQKKKILDQYERVYKLKDEAIQWIKRQKGNITEAKELINRLEAESELLKGMPMHIMHRLALIDCVEIKRKILSTIQSTQHMIYECMDNKVKQLNKQALNKMQTCLKSLNQQIITTEDYVQVSQILEKIKDHDTNTISKLINDAKQILLNLCDLTCGYSSYDILAKIYSTHKVFISMATKLEYHQKRINKEKIQLENAIKQRKSTFMTGLSAYFKEKVDEINSYIVRRNYDQYIKSLEKVSAKTEQFKAQIKEINREEENLSWAPIIFSEASQLDNLVSSNLQTWTLIGKFDKTIRQWKPVQLSAMKSQECDRIVKEFEESFSRLLKRLKNFNMLKIGHEVYNEIQQINLQQLQIIKIFSQPGLKDRHWQLFNKKLNIPGYDLKDICYGKIKILYDYQKNLKVLMSISNQASKEYEIQNQRNSMQQYWAKQSFKTYNIQDQNIVCISTQFLDQKIAIIDTQIMRTSLLKNSPFSKALNQILIDWQVWLVGGRNILENLYKAQQKFLSVKFLFLNEQTPKYVPIQSTQFESVQSIWKSIIKRISQQPKFVDFCKNQKMLQLLQQIVKKINFIKNGISSYLNAKRAQFPRLSFTTDSCLIEILSALNQRKKQKAMFEYLLRRCFNGVQKAVYNQNEYFAVCNGLDKVEFSIKKMRNKPLCDLKAIQIATKATIRAQIREIHEKLIQQTKEKQIQYIFQNFKRQHIKHSCQQQNKNDDRSSILINLPRKQSSRNLPRASCLKKGRSVINNQILNQSKSSFNPKNNLKLRPANNMQESSIKLRKQMSSSKQDDDSIKTITSIRCYNQIKHTKNLKQHLQEGSLDFYRSNLKQKIHRCANQLQKQIPKQYKGRLQLFIGQVLSQYDSCMRLSSQSLFVTQDPLSSYEWLSLIKFNYNQQSQQVILGCWNQQLIYDFQYYGNQTVTFVPQFTQKYHYFVASCLKKHYSPTIKGKIGSGLAQNTVRLLANISGHYICQVPKLFVQSVIFKIGSLVGKQYSLFNNPNFIGGLIAKKITQVERTASDNNHPTSLSGQSFTSGVQSNINQFSSLIIGLISNNCWNLIKAQDWYQNQQSYTLASSCLAVINRYLLQFRYKCISKVEFVTFNDAQIKINPKSACFLLDFENKNACHRLDNMILTNFRSINFVNPSEQFLQNVRNSNQLERGYGHLKLLGQLFYNRKYGICRSLKMLLNYFLIAIEPNQKKQLFGDIGLHLKFQQLEKILDQKIQQDNQLQPQLKQFLFGRIVEQQLQLEAIQSIQQQKSSLQYKQTLKLVFAKVQQYIRNLIKNPVFFQLFTKSLMTILHLQTHDLQNQRGLEFNSPIPQQNIPQIEKKKSSMLFRSHQELQLKNQVGKTEKGLQTLQKQDKIEQIVITQFQKDQQKLRQIIKEPFSEPLKRNVLVYGETSYKTCLIKKVFKQANKQYFLQHRANLGVLADPLKGTTSFLNYSQYLKKIVLFIERTIQNQAIKSKTVNISTKNTINKSSRKPTATEDRFTSEKQNNSKKEHIWVIIDGHIKNQHAETINNMDYALSLSNLCIHQNYRNNLRHLIEATQIHNISPSILSSFTNIFIDERRISNLQVYQNWKRTVSVELPLKEVQIQILQELAAYFDSIISIGQKVKQNYRKSASSEVQQLLNLSPRLVICRRVLNFFGIYLKNLRSKQTEALPEFDTPRYIRNSFSYAVYWEVGMSCFQEPQLRNLQGTLRNYMKTDMELQGWMCDSFLNQENEWINWISLQQDFAPDKQTPCVYNLWVPTMDNTRLYTIAIKLIQSGSSLTVIGNQCGKSTMLRELSNFEISYSSFLIDCHRHTRSNDVYKTIKNKILFTEHSKNLIMIDDLNLPLQNQSISQILRSIVDGKTLTNMESIGKINLNLKQPAILVTISNSRNTVSKSSLNRLINKTHLITLNQLSQREIDTIFRPYINFTLATAQFPEQIIKSESAITSIITKSFKFDQASFSIHDLRHIVQKVCKLQKKHFTDKHAIIQHVGWLLHQIGEQNISNLDMRTEFNKLVHDQSMRALSMISKNFREWEKKMKTYIFTDLQSISGGHFQEQRLQQNQNIQIYQQIFTQVLAKKGINQFTCSKYHTKMLINLINSLRYPSSHVIIVANKMSGSKTLVKMATHLNGLGYLNLSNYKVEQFKAQILNIIKQGGKIDECVCLLPNKDKLRQQFMGTVNSLVCSPQFHQLFDEIQMQQIIKSFNSDKKFIKKDVKKSELIKKIREKVNNIFHCAICLDTLQLRNLKNEYPNVVKSSQIVLINEWPQQALISIGKTVLLKEDLSEEYVKPLITMAKQAKRLILKANRKATQQSNFTNLDQYAVFNTFKILFRQFKNCQNKQNENAQVWHDRIKESQQKIKSHQSERESILIEKQAQESSLQTFINLIQQKTKDMNQYKSEFHKIEPQYDAQKPKLQEISNSIILLKQEFRKSVDEIQIKCLIGSQGIKFGLVMLQDIADQRIKTISEIVGLLNNNEGFQIQNAQELIFNLKNLNNLVEDYILDGQFNKIKQGFSRSNSELFVLKQQQQLYFKNDFVLGELKADQKQIIVITTVKWIEGLTIYAKSMVDRLQEKASLGGQFENLQKRYFQLQSMFRELEDEIQEIKEQCSDKQSKQIDYRSTLLEIQQKIDQSKTVCQVLSKFENIMLSKNAYNQVCTKDISAQLMVYSILISYSGFIFDSVIHSQILQSCTKILSSHKLTFQARNIEYLLPFEAKFKLQHSVAQKDLMHYLTYVGISNCELYCACIDQEDMLRSWIDKLFVQKIGDAHSNINNKQYCKNQQNLGLKKQTVRYYRFIGSSDIEAIKQTIAQGDIAFVRNPTLESLEKMNNLIARKVSIKNSLPIIQIDGQVSLNKEAKIVFVFDSHLKIPKQLRYSSTWIFKFESTENTLRRNFCFMYRQTLLKNQNENMEKPNEIKLTIKQMVKNYLEKINQLNTFDEKVHALLAKIRKTHENDNIFKKIQEISDSKNLLEEYINKYYIMIKKQVSEICQAGNKLCTQAINFYSSVIQPDNLKERKESKASAIKYPEFFSIFFGLVNKIITRDQCISNQELESIISVLQLSSICQDQQLQLHFSIIKAIVQKISESQGEEQYKKLIENLKKTIFAFKQNALANSKYRKALSQVLENSPNRMPIIIQVDRQEEIPWIKLVIEGLLQLNNLNLQIRPFNYMLKPMNKTQQKTVIVSEVLLQYQWKQIQKQYIQAKQVQQSIIITCLRKSSLFEKSLLINLNLQSLIPQILSVLIMRDNQNHALKFAFLIQKLGQQKGKLDILEVLGKLKEIQLLQDLSKVNYQNTEEQNHALKCKKIIQRIGRILEAKELD